MYPQSIGQRLLHARVHFPSGPLELAGFHGDCDGVSDEGASFRRLKLVSFMFACSGEWRGEKVSMKNDLTLFRQLRTRISEAMLAVFLGG